MPSILPEEAVEAPPHQKLNRRSIPLGPFVSKFFYRLSTDDFVRIPDNDNVLILGFKGQLLKPFLNRVSHVVQVVEPKGAPRFAVLIASHDVDYLVFKRPEPGIVSVQFVMQRFFFSKRRVVTLYKNMNIYRGGI